MVQWLAGVWLRWVGCWFNGWLVCGFGRLGIASMDLSDPGRLLCWHWCFDPFPFPMPTSGQVYWCLFIGSKFNTNNVVLFGKIFVTVIISVILYDVPGTFQTVFAPFKVSRFAPPYTSMPLPAPPCPSLPSIFRPAPSRHTALAGPRRLADPVGSLASHRGMAMLCTRHSGDQLSKRLAPTISSGALCCFRRGLGYGGIARRVAAGRLPHGVPHGGFD